MRFILNIIVASLTIASCTHDPKKNSRSSASKEDSIPLMENSEKWLATTSTNSSHGDTLLVDRRAAVFIEPDSTKIEKNKKQAGEENFYTAADDYLFYLNKAHQFLDSVKLISISAKDRKYITFIQNDSSIHLVNLQKLPELFNLYFFDPSKKAKQVNLTSIDEEYKRYFK